MNTSPTVSAPGRALPLWGIVLLALAVHGALLLMQLPIASYDANTHIFFSAHYAQHWFDPWNEKWFAGFSQTTYPPLVHQWIAIFSKVMTLRLAYMFVQLAVILLLPVGMFRYARLWVNERAASYAAIGSIFLGSLAMIVYQSGQLPTTMAAVLVLNALPYFHQWSRAGSGAALVKGLLLSWSAAAAHHVTFLFGTVLFAVPVLWLALVDRDADGEHASAGVVIFRAAAFAAIGAIGVAIVLLPYWVQLIQNPIKQLPIPHSSRDNYIRTWLSGVNFWVIPYGGLILALPFIFLRGAGDRRLRPLFLGWWITFLFGLGGTTPFGKIILGRAYEVLTYERFTFWSTLMALPIAALLAERIVERFGAKAVAALTVVAVGTFATGVAWITYNPIQAPQFNVRPVIDFMNRDNHNQFRYMTLGFGSQFSEVSTFANAGTVDGDYNSARLLPEMTPYGAGKLDNSKYYGAAGMESLRAMLKHANQYGLKYIFVRDRFYDPLLAFAGWRPAETYNDGAVVLWTKEDVPPAHRMDYGVVPPAWQGLLWGLLPMGVCILAIAAVLALPDRRAFGAAIPFPAPEPVFLREAK